MQKLAEAKQLKVKAEGYTSQGNYEYAIKAYRKINSLLKEAILQSKSQEIISQINLKIHSFEKTIQELNQMQTEKEEMKKKLTSQFGFPKDPQEQIKKELLEGIKNIPEKKTEPKKEEQNKITPQEIPEVKKEVKKPEVNLNSKRNTVPVVPYDHKKPIAKPAIKKQVVVIQKKPILPIKKQQNSLDRKKPGTKPQKIVIDPAVEQLIVHKNQVTFNDIVGLHEAKDILEEAVIRPRKRPDLYTGIRAPPRALLLYGPPGNGKTYLCKALANESKCTFIALSASSILNKYVGESQKTIKKIFAAAQSLAPSIIFIDQIDSMLTARTENENDAARRLKTEFLVLMDGINSPKSGDILVIGATNLPKQLDNAAKRRFSKFVYIGNPESLARKQMILRNLKGVEYDLTEADLDKIVEMLQYFSASEIRNIVAEACMYPLRQLQKSKFEKISTSQIRKVSIKDFMLVISERKPIVSPQELAKYKEKI